MARQTRCKGTFYVSAQQCLIRRRPVSRHRCLSGCSWFGSLVAGLLECQDTNSSTSSSLAWLDSRGNAQKNMTQDTPEKSAAAHV